MHEGRVVTGHRQIVVVEDPRGNLVECNIRRKVGRVVCGDRVKWRSTSRGQGVVEATLPRSTLIERHDSNGRSKPLAANVDQVIITSAPRPPLSENLIDRYLVASELVGANAVVLINKSDLLDKNHQADLDARLLAYKHIGYPVLFCNTVTAHGIDELVDVLGNQTSILVGQSGVGKSSLVRALLPDQKIRIGHLSTNSGLGRHTTTSTTLYPLSKDSFLVDSPGVRDFQLWHVEAGQITKGFREFEPYVEKCRFHNCRHLREPGCAVDMAADNDKISKRRLQSYRTIVGKLENKR